MVCNKLYKTDNSPLIDRYEKFLRSISICTFKKISELLQKIYKCTIKENSNIKLGYTYICYIDATLCKAMFLYIQLLSPHFLKIRYFTFSLSNDKFLSENVKFRRIFNFC